MPGSDSLLARLVDHKVEFVVVGGVAAVVHGASLVTQDIDICCRFSVDNLMRLQDAIWDLHPVHRMTPTRQPLRLTPDQCSALKNLYLDTDSGPLDCLSSIDGVGDYEATAAQTIKAELPPGECRILCIDALIRSKEAMNRPRDKDAVLLLRAIRERVDPEDPSQKGTEHDQT